MADHAIQREELEIDAPAAVCLAVASDVERYPEWAPDLKQAEVVSRDAQGRPERVAFRVAALGHSTSYTLRYNWSALPERISWVLTEGDVTTKLDGSYEFIPVDDDPQRTLVRYVLEVELVVPLPNIVKRRAELKIMHTALRDLKARVEVVASAADA
jgi:ribosome-associated toxin RatA of RatAB toxin-antitoxin module